MAHSNRNVLTSTYSGRVGNLILQRNRVIKPGPGKKKRVRSEKQKQNNARFKRATEYAGQVHTDPQAMAYFEKALVKVHRNKRRKNIRIRHLAIRYFMKSPAIVNDSCIIPRGTSGGEILVAVSNIIRVEHVTILLMAPCGKINAGGTAHLSHLREVCVANLVVAELPPALPGSIVRVAAWDAYGNGSGMDFDFYCDPQISERTSRNVKQAQTRQEPVGPRKDNP